MSGTPEDLADALDFLDAIARRFDGKADNPSRAHLARWASGYNAESCRRVSALIQSLSSQLAEAQAELEDIREALGDAYDSGASATSLLPAINKIDAILAALAGKAGEA